MEIPMENRDGHRRHIYLGKRMVPEGEVGLYWGFHDWSDALGCCKEDGPKGGQR
jgi:hypothetical protein